MPTHENCVRLHFCLKSSLGECKVIVLKRCAASTTANAPNNKMTIYVHGVRTAYGHYYLKPGPAHNTMVTDDGYTDAMNQYHEASEPEVV